MKKFIAAALFVATQWQPAHAQAILATRLLLLTAKSIGSQNRLDPSKMTRNGSHGQWAKETEVPKASLAAVRLSPTI